ATVIGLDHIREIRELAPPPPDSQWAMTRERFTMKTVDEELAPFFVDVVVEPVPGPQDLEVTELEHLLDFARSRGDVGEDELEPLRRAAERDIAAQGFFRVSRATARVRADKP